LLQQGALPARDVFEELAPVMRDPAVAALRFRYLRGEDRSWHERWSGADKGALPAAVEVTLTTARGAEPPVVIPLRTVSP
jgi:hypothetical protein